MRHTPLALACCALALTLAAPAEAARHDWNRFGYDAARSNFSKSRAGINAGDLAKLKRQDVAVPGTVDSSPIYLHDVKVAGKKRDVFIATTSYGRVFALDATNGTRLWTFSPPTVGALEGSHQITQSTPIADRKNGFVYSASPDGQIRKLRLKDGTQVTSGSWPTVINLDPVHEKIGTPLNFSGDNVIATTGGYTGDTPPYQGKVVLVNRGSGKVVRVFHGLCSNRTGIAAPLTCDETGSAIWARAGAVVVPGSRRILVATGDGDFNGSTMWGDSVVQLSPGAKRVFGHWTPTNEQSLDSGDVDLGSTAPALLRSGDRWLALQGGKDGKFRLLDVADLNGRDGPCDCKGGELQTIDAPGGGVFTAPAVWRKDGRTWAFAAGLFGETEAFRLTTGANPQLQRMWKVGRGGTSPVIAGGLLYVYDPSGGIAIYRPKTGKLVGTLGAAGGHWNIPIVADGRLAIGTGDSNFHRTTGTFTIYRKP